MMAKEKSFRIMLEEGDEIIERDIKNFGGNASHIILPAKHRDKKAFIIISKKIEGEVRGKKE